ncbi:MAG: hypothetical protein UDB15_07875 [Ruminococcus sp.]|nr:hypothetical protein [Ruminococcus sp.]
MGQLNMINTNEDLQKLVQYAYSDVKYYHDLFDSLNISPDEINSIEKLQLIPVLKKEYIQKDVSNFVGKTYQRYPKNSDIELRRTSGSTGRYLKIYWHRKENIKSLLSLWKARNRWHSISPEMKFCSFFTVNYQGNKIAEARQKEINYSGRNLAFCKVGLSTEKLAEYYNDILNFEPDWLNLQPSMAALLSHFIKENNMSVPKSLKYIELTGELLLDSDRNLIEDVFHIRPINMYGTNETNGIAIECNHGNLHILEDNVIVEVLKNGMPVMDEEGDIFVTCLNNYAMPFIRYETGDKGVYHSYSCPCGRNTGIITVNSGRSSDVIHLLNNVNISSYVLVSIIEYTNEYMSGAISQFQFIQRGIDDFKAVFALKPAFINWKEAICEAFLSNIKDPRLKSIHWEFKFVDRIYPDENTGKLKYFVNKMNRLEEK